MNLRPKSEDLNEDTRFTWPVFADGLKWGNEAGAIGTERVLIPVNGGRLAKLYRPLEDFPELFDEFSRLDSEETIASFAGKFGWLGMASYAQFPRNGVGEAYADWRNNIETMKIALAVMDLIDAGNSRALREFIHWETVGSEVMVRFSCLVQGQSIVKSLVPPQKFTGMWRQELIASSSTPSGIGCRFLAIWNKGDVIGPAKGFLSLLFDRVLHKQVSPRLSLDSTGNLVAYQYPSSLLAALWLQAYRAATGERRFRRCEICSRRIDVTDSRSHKRVHQSCSLKLRMRRYRSKNV